MPGILRLAAGSLFLILNVLFLTAAAQTKDLLKEDLKSESGLIESTQTAIDRKTFTGKDTDFFTPHKSEPISRRADEPDTTGGRTNYKHRRGAIEYNFEFGVSPFEPTRFMGPKEYNTAGRKMGTFDFRIGRTIGTKGGVTYAYMFGVTPLVVALKNEVRNPAYISETATPNVYPTRRETTYGIGIAPANFRFTFLPKRRVKPFIKLGAGFLYFNKSMPITTSGRYHFMGDYGGGFMVHLKNPKHFLTFGYRYFHISNANLYGKENNPGYNSNTFYIGFSFFK